MSCCIYPAYLYKDNATLEDVSNLVKELHEIKQKFLPYMIKTFKTDIVLKGSIERMYPTAEDAFKIRWGRHDHSLVNRIKKETAGYERGCIFDFQCDVVIYFVDNKIVLHGFCSSNTEKFFKENFKSLKDYSYYDIYAGDGPISKKMAKDFSERGDFYDKVFEKSTIPSNVGLQYEFYNDDLLYDLEDALLSDRFGKDWDLEYRRKRAEASTDDYKEGSIRVTTCRC